MGGGVGRMMAGSSFMSVDYPVSILYHAIKPTPVALPTGQSVIEPVEAPVAVAAPVEAPDVVPGEARGCLKSRGSPFRN